MATTSTNNLDLLDQPTETWSSTVNKVNQNSTKIAAGLDTKLTVTSGGVVLGQLSSSLQDAVAKAVSAVQLVDGKLPSEILPALNLLQVETAASQAAMLALVPDTGAAVMAIRTDAGGGVAAQYILPTGADATVLGNWIAVPTATGVTSVDKGSGPETGAITGIASAAALAAEVTRATAAETSLSNAIATSSGVPAGGLPYTSLDYALQNKVDRGTEATDLYHDHLIHNERSIGVHGMGDPAQYVSGMVLGFMPYKRVETMSRLNRVAERDLTNGTLFMATILPMTSFTAARFIIQCGSVTTVGATVLKMCLYEVTRATSVGAGQLAAFARVPVAMSDHTPTLLNTANTEKEVAFSTASGLPATVVMKPGVEYRIGILAVGQTQVAKVRGANIGTSLATTTPRLVEVMTGQTDITTTPIPSTLSASTTPANTTPSITAAGSDFSIWMGVEP